METLVIKPSFRAERSEIEGSRHVSFKVSPRDPFRGAGFQPVGQAGVSPAAGFDRRDACLPHSRGRLHHAARDDHKLYACAS